VSLKVYVMRLAWAEDVARKAKAPTESRDRTADMFSS
jgi:hypothetical protein